MKFFSLGTHILIAVVLAVAVFLGTYEVCSYRFKRRERNEQVAHNLESVEKLFVGFLHSDANLMAAALRLIVSDRELRSAFKGNDRKAMLDLTLDPFGHLQTEHGITHLYFIDPNRFNSLRVHKPEKHGDKINHFTLSEAEKTGKVSYGMELGQFGTMTLRVVQPWYEGGQLIGYVEMGEYVDHIISRLRDILGVEIYLAIEKAFLDRKNWEAGMRMLGQDAEWDRFPSVVVISQTMDVIPQRIAEFLAEEYYTSMERDVEVSLKGREYRAGFVRVNDASGRGVGDMVVLTEVVGPMADSRATAFLIGGTCLAAIGVLLMLVYMLGKSRGKGKAVS